MRLALWLGGFAVAIACSATQATPNGTVVARFDAKKSSWAALAAAAPNAREIEEKTFDAAGKDGASVSIQYKTGVVELSGKPTKVPLEATATVTDAQGFAVSGSFSDGPIHYAGMPEDVRALDLHTTLSRGTRSCSGTSYTNDSLRVRIHGDGSARILPDPAPPAGSAAPPMR
jgi:hypothetical protein